MRRPLTRSRLRKLDRHPQTAITGLIPALSAFEVPEGAPPTWPETLHQQVLLLPNMPNEEAPSTPKQRKQPHPQKSSRE